MRVFVILISILHISRDYDIEECKKTVYEAIKNGINFIDTAPWYGHGESEKVLGEVHKTIIIMDANCQFMMMPRA